MKPPEESQAKDELLTPLGEINQLVAQTKKEKEPEFTPKLVISRVWERGSP